MSENININTLTKKRGRKSKKTLESIQNANPETNGENNILMNIAEDNIILSNNEINLENETNQENEIIESENRNEENILKAESEKPVPKKRGRKPKGGKIIQQVVPLNNAKESKPNIILHLRCSLKDLQNNNLYGSTIDNFSFQSNQMELNYNADHNNDTPFEETLFGSNKAIETTEYDSELDLEYNTDICKKDNDIRDIWKKLKVLEHCMHVNNVGNKKSACFWDTYDFDNPPIYIPKHFINNTYQVYGCFCSPECAVAYLMKEQIDTSTKFERYYLLNSIYGKIYEYNKNIKPAPNPHYMLEKYYGNLNIQEFRSLLRNERLFLVVDKPLTRIMPELHEDNDDFIINNKIIPSNKYQVKRRLNKKQTKTNILSERFGLVH